MAMTWRRFLVLCTLTTAGCGGHGSGDTGDPRTKPSPDVLGDGARIADLVGEATWYRADDMMSLQCSTPLDRQVSITGQVVSALDRFDETGEGAVGNIYIQDLPVDAPAAPYSGMTIFAPAFTPPDLRLFEGDVVDTFGNLQEFPGPTSGRFPNCRTLPEIGGTMRFRFEDGDLEPLTIVPAGAGYDRFAPVTGYANARQWLGMLVRLEGVAASGAPNDAASGRYSVSIDIGGGTLADQITINNELFDLKSAGIQFATGTRLRSVTGVWTYFYGFHIAPRDASDIELE